jgi:EAL domain-containing protein (putative c-di-GMP-specific phosphodiesterase class I)/ActR/RegA family two-component response regulator
MSAPTNASKLAYVLDDETEVGKVVCQVLLVTGHMPRQFTTPHPFLVEIKSTPPDLVVLDLALGQTDAVEIIRQLEVLKYTGKVLLISGRDESLLNKIKAIGCSRGLAMLPPLQKPFRAHQLRASVESEPEITRPATPKAAPAGRNVTIDPGEALRNHWLELWYQAKIDLKTMKVAGAEALLRARHPDFGVVSPAQLLPPPGDPLFEPITNFVIQQSLADWDYLARQQLVLRLAVNVPISVMQTAGFVRAVRDVMPTDPRFPGMILEVTEDEATREVEWMRELAAQLRLYNILLAIDDFGTGFSSLSRLHELPCAEIKLDRSFVSGCAVDSGKQSLCSAAIELAHGFGASVCAEGIEAIEDLRTLIDLRCDTAQGYLFSKPMPITDFAALLSGKRAQSSAGTSPVEAAAAGGQLMAKAG